VGVGADLDKWDIKPRPSIEPRVEIKIDYVKTSGDKDHHVYETRIEMRNVSGALIKDYLAELQFPKWFVQSNILIAAEERALATKTHRVFRHENHTGKPLLPGEGRWILHLTYVMNHELFWKYSHGPEFKEPVEVRVFVGDHLAGEASRPFEQMQNF
jgi:hypothetical protein